MYFNGKIEEVLECMVYGTVEVYKIDCLSSIQVTIRSNSLIWNHTLYEFDYALYSMMLDEYVELLSIRIFREYKTSILKHYIKDKYL